MVSIATAAKQNVVRRRPERRVGEVGVDGRRAALGLLVSSLDRGARVGEARVGARAVESARGARRLQRLRGHADLAAGLGQLHQGIHVGGRQRNVAQVDLGRPVVLLGQEIEMGEILESGGVGGVDLDRLLIAVAGLVVALDLLVEHAEIVEEGSGRRHPRRGQRPLVGIDGQRGHVALFVDPRQQRAVLGLGGVERERYERLVLRRRGIPDGHVVEGHAEPVTILAVLGSVELRAAVEKRLGLLRPVPASRRSAPARRGRARAPPSPPSPE